MKSLDFGRCLLYAGAIGALLAGCGGLQPPIGRPNAMSQSRASTGYALLYSFGASADGQTPKAGLTDLNGALYGTTYGGGRHGDGTVFSITMTGSEKVLYSFGGNRDGANPAAGLVAGEGLLYGTTEHGGVRVESDGTVFSISTTGTETVLHRFHGYYHDGRFNYGGANPVASLIYVNSKLYGTTLNGGSYQFYGTVFRLSTTGTEKVLYSFTDPAVDGINPAAGLTDVNGTFYGTTEFGGYPYVHGHAGDYGTVFSVDTTGTEKMLYKFGGYGDGAYPVAGLTKVHGILYGTTNKGGGGYGDGTVFSITTTGAEKILHSFGAGSDGGSPAAALLNVKGTLYGTTSQGGTYGRGTVFSINPTTGAETVLHNFGNGSDGATPLAGMIDVKGTLYGTTSAGGTNGNGTVFALTP